MAQVAPPTTAYGPPISLGDAKKAMAAAEAEATKNGWGVAIAIVDSGANLVMLQRLDNAQLSLMSWTCGSFASAMVSGIETSAPGPGLR